MQVVSRRYCHLYDHFKENNNNNNSNNNNNVTSSFLSLSPYEEKPCEIPCPVDCLTSYWSPWSPMKNQLRPIRRRLERPATNRIAGNQCNRVSYKIRVRLLVGFSQFGGRACSKEGLEQIRPLPFVECFRWVLSDWSECLIEDGYCGFGEQRRTIKCQRYNNNNNNNKNNNNNNNNNNAGFQSRSRVVLRPFDNNDSNNNNNNSNNNSNSNKNNTVKKFSIDYANNCNQLKDHIEYRTCDYDDDDDDNYNNNNNNNNNNNKFGDYHDDVDHFCPSFYWDRRSREENSSIKISFGVNNNNNNNNNNNKNNNNNNNNNNYDDPDNDNKSDDDDDDDAEMVCKRSDGLIIHGACYQADDNHVKKNFENDDDNESDDGDDDGDGDDNNDDDEYSFGCYIHPSSSSNSSSDCNGNDSNCKGKSGSCSNAMNSSEIVTATSTAELASNYLSNV
ncbi:hypothetical protein HELRODRAFT_176998 [Helobdella robusta]|uniref:Uncharacterized protein n=1 Tax=Helobdella robusta TaxID=6412 RepID=T1FB42_HELRO|nr:hypothetical protein HELRODRAFT_176998 [Helobdella robusta]ESN98519.1 hypothetical protein HELRODRAFT_176998 [Helobdella robusta]